MLTLNKSIGWAVVCQTWARAALWHDSEPCTPLACTVVAKTVHESLAGLEAVVIGRSTIVGKPLAQLLIAAYRRHAEA